VLAALDTERFEPVLIGIDKDGRWLLQDAQRLLASARDPRLVRIESGSPVEVRGTPGGRGTGALDVVFPVLHGTLGEDGAVQGLLEVAGIPYVGAGILGSAVGMDKDVMKRLLRDAGIPVTAFQTVRRARFDRDPERVRRELTALGFPLFVKPANAGSSVGITKVARAEDIERALRKAFEFDSKALGEAAVDGREIELAVLGGDPPAVSVAGEITIEHPDGFYSYDAKYIDEKGVRFDLPAHLSAEQLSEAQAMALHTFEVLECEGLARVDLFLTADGRFLVNEINTLPGFTAISMYPKLWALSGIAQKELVSRLIDLALDRARRRAQLRRSVGSDKEGS
jgi:D-alanine-D-alanine ligase